MRKMETMVETGNLEGLYRYASRGPDFTQHVKECLNIYGESLFFQACAKGKLDCANYLFELGADIHAVNVYGETALHKVAQQGHMDLVDFLLFHKADINARCSHEETPIMRSIRHNQEKLTLHLILKGADTSLEDVGGSTPLMYALCYGKHELCLSMLTVGISIRNTKTVSPLILACQLKFTPMIERLLKLGAVRDHQTCAKALVVVAQHPYPYSTLLMMMENGVHPNRKSPHRNHPFVEICSNFHLLREGGMPMYIDLFLRFGANVNARGTNNDTAILRATKRNDVEAVEYLLLKGANPNIKNNNGVNPLSFACKKGNYPMVQLLLPYCNLSIKCAYQETYLMCAAYTDNVDCLKLLLKFHRFPMSDKNVMGATALDIAMDYEHYDASYFLQEVRETQSMTTMDDLAHVSMDLDVWRRVLPKAGLRDLDRCLMSHRVDTLACYHALFLHEDVLLERFRRGCLVNWSTARIRELTRAMGSRPIRVRVVEYLVFQKVSRDKLAMMLRQR